MVSELRVLVLILASRRGTGEQMRVRSFEHSLTFALVLALNLNDICIKCDNSGMI